MSADLDRFDRAIDRAVREMLDVEPPADLRANVIARIDERPVASFRLSVASFRRFAAVGSAAALLVLVLGLVLARRSEPPAQPLFATKGVDVRLPAPEPVTAAATTAKIAVREAPQAAARLAYAASIDTAPHAEGIDPLKAIAPIEVAPIAQSNITPEPIAVRPLNPITEVQIAPLNPPDGRD